MLDMEDFAKLIKKIDDFFRDFFDMRESYFMTRLPSVPLEFPKLANAQLSNFGPLRILRKEIKKVDYEFLHKILLTYNFESLIRRRSNL